MDELKFQQRPAQPYASDILGVLQALSGLGLNVAGAVTKTGAVGNQLLSQSQQTQQQATENQREAQKMVGLEQQAAALWNKANVQPGMTAPVLNTVRASLENRDLNNAQEEMRWAESVFRDKTRENKNDRNALVQEARYHINALDAQTKADPNSRIARAARLLDGKPRDKWTNSNLEAWLAPLAKGEKDLKDLRKSVVNLMHTEAGWFGRKGDPLTADQVFANDEGLRGADVTAKQLEQMRLLLPDLASKDSKRQDAALKKFVELRDGGAATSEEKKREELLKQIQGK